MLLQYADRLPIGLKEIVETVPASTVHAFYRRWYRPENMAVIIAGDFDPAAVKELADAAMSTCHWPSVTSPTPIPECALCPLFDQPCSRMLNAWHTRCSWSSPEEGKDIRSCTETILLHEALSTGHIGVEVSH